MAKRINIGIADDHVVLRKGLLSLLKEYDNIKVLFDVDNGRDLLEKLKSAKPDVILLDIEMPVMNGREALEKINERHPNIKVIIMSMHFHDTYIIDFIKKGARAFLPKNCDIDKIVDAIHAVHENGHYFDSKVSLVMANMIKSMPVKNTIIMDIEFTKREIEIIKLICLNLTNTEIAKELYLSSRTVEGHRLNISKKTDTTGVAELKEYAVLHGIL